MAGESLIPVALSPLVGRSDERADAARLLAECRLLTLLGPGGIGKTRLAREVAVIAAPRHPDGAHWVDLAGVRDPALVVAAVAAATGVHERRSQDLVETLAEHLRERRSLLVLDCCEHVVAACAALLTRVLPVCPDLTVLATSREALAVDGEVTYVVPPLPVPGRTPTPSAVEVGAAAAVRLFEQRARQVQTGFRLDDGNAAAVAEICRRLDGIPLAIELAAARVRVLAPAQIVDALSDRFGLLTGGRSAPTRQRTLEASVDWSYDLLDDAQRRLLTRLSVFAGSFDLEAAETVAGDAGADAAEVLDRLTDLVDRSLVQVVQVDGASRYRLLETISVYGRRRLPELDDPARVRDRHLAHVVDLADRARAGLNAPDPRPWLERLAADLDDLRAAMDWAVESGQPLAVLDLAEATFSFWIVRGLYQEMRRRLAAAVSAPAVDDVGRARGLTTASILTLMGGDHGSGHEFASQAVPLARQVGDEPTLARALTFRGWCGYLSGAASLVDVRADSDESVTLAERLGDRELLARALLYAGTLAATGARTFEEGRASLERAIAEMEDAGFAYMQVPARAFLGTVLVLPGGQLADAREQARLALEQGRQIGLGSFVALALGVLGLADAMAGDEASARGHFDEALAVVRHDGLSGFEIPVRSRSALVDYRFGHAARARDEARAVLHAAEESGARSELLASHWLLGVLALEAGDHTMAEEHLARTRAVASDPRYPSELGRALLALSRLRRADDEHAEAWELAHEALDVLADFGDRPGTLDALEAVGGLAIALGRPEAGLRLLSAADRTRAATGLTRFPLEAAAHTPDVDAARVQLGARAARARWAEGSELSIGEAVAYGQRGRGDRDRPKVGWSALTPSEREVVGLVAAGCSNAEIAERLFMSVNTVKTHLRHVYDKLQVTGRAALAAQASRRDL
jgi:predicted ATPase/DNA-binding CsgD family transcriptional regulator/tetratricopeptide (TPR) repeat protein